jgi:hypothetical protein
MQSFINWKDDEERDQMIGARLVSQLFPGKASGEIVNVDDAAVTQHAGD